MHINAHLDVDVVPVETEDQLSVLIELTAPSAATTDTPRPPSTLQIVLDRSGSMAGPRLEGAKLALQRLVDRLAPTDNLGLRSCSTTRVSTVVPAGALTSKDAVRRAIGEHRPGGRHRSVGRPICAGLQEARRVAGPAGATLLLIGDGHANAGVVDPERLRGVAAEAREHNVTTSTLGFGLGYDERIMSALALGGAGSELFAEEADTAVEAHRGRGRRSARADHPGRVADDPADHLRTGGAGE